MGGTTASQQAYAQQLDEARAKKNVTEKKNAPGFLGGLPQKMARNAMLGMSLMASQPTTPTYTSEPTHQQATKQSDQARVEKLNNDRAQAASQKSSLGLDVNAQRFANNGNLSEQRVAEAEAQVADMTQKMRTATTLAEAQALRLQYMQLNKQLTEEGMQNQLDKLKDAFRTWMWRGAADCGPLIDACTMGLDMGVGTMISDSIVTFQFVYGSALYGKEEPSYLHNMFVPTPTRVKPLENDPDAKSTTKTVMKWYDIDVLILNYIGWTPIIIATGIVGILLMYTVTVCFDSSNVAAAASDGICRTLGAVATGGISEVVRAAGSN